MIKVYDSNGTLVLPGHILECPECDADDAERYHAVYVDEHYKEELCIRDLGNNNVYTYQNFDAFYVKGFYWECLDLLSDADLNYYFQTNRQSAEYIRDNFIRRELDTKK